MTVDLLSPGTTIAGCKYSEREGDVGLILLCLIMIEVLSSTFYIKYGMNHMLCAFKTGKTWKANTVMVCQE